LVESYLKEKGIKFVHGQPYHPQSQGLIERANRTIQTALSGIYYQQQNNSFDLESSLIDVLTEYNNNMHSSTKTTPVTTFKLDPNNEKDRQMIDWIKENVKNAFKTKLNLIKYNVGQKVLVYSGVVKSKDHQYLRKNLSKKKTVKGYAIPAIIVQLE